MSDHTESKTKKVCILTGGNTGIGFVAARKLVSQDIHVILACRNAQKASEAVDQIKKATQKDNVESMTLDLASFKSIRSFVDEFHSKKLPLHILINNGGIFADKITKTEDGFESTFGVNHLGHFLLTNLLLPDLKKSAPSRVVVVSSLAHIPGKVPGADPKFVWTMQDMESQKDLDLVYKNSKLANVWFTFELARRMEGTGVTVNAICPGFIPTTGLVRNKKGMAKFFLKHVASHLPFAVNEDTGANCEVHCATDPKLEKVTGKFFSKMKEYPSSPDGNNVELQKKLWDLSEEWTKQK
jgi:light-dependent protochlorophyllide reductase